MRAVIPAAGIGKRLRPLTLTCPKVLIPVAGKPILGHILDRVIESGIRELSIIVGYLGAQVIDYVRQNYDLECDFIEQKVRKGLGHAVGMGLTATDEPVLILLGDTILDMDFRAFSGCRDNIIGVMKVEDPRRFGIVEVEGDWVKSLIEKPDHPASNLGIAGVYLIQSQRALKNAVEYLVAQEITTKGEYQLTDALSVMLRNGHPMKIEEVRACHDCGTRETLLQTNRHLLHTLKNDAAPFPEALIIPPVSIHPDVIIKRSVVGPNVSIGAGTQIENSIVEDSIIAEENIIQNAIIRESLVGSRCTVSGEARTVDLGDYSRWEFS